MAFEQPPPRASIPLGWIIAISAFGLLVTMVFAAMMISGVGRRVSRSVTGTVSVPLRAPAHERAMVGLPVAQLGETALNASNADQVVSSGNETTFTKTFALDNGTSFSLKNINGSITVTSWDQPIAEVKAIQNGSETARQVFFTIDPASLSVRATKPNQEVRFEVRLPSELRRVDLNSVNGSISISNVNAAMTIQNVNGAIDLAVRPGFDANLEASSARGSINIGDQFGLAVQKEDLGQLARGQIGAGGQLLKLSTVNGSISLKNGDTQRIGPAPQPLKLTTVNGSIKLANRNTQETHEKAKTKLAR